MITRQVAELLRGARRSLGWSQKEAAARAGVSHRLWSEVERGERPNVSFETALRMLGRVGVTVRLTDALGMAAELRDPELAGAARAARAAVRRTTWSGRQLRLHDEDTEPIASVGADRIADVTLVSQQAHAVARSRPSRAQRAQGGRSPRR